MRKWIVISVQSLNKNTTERRNNEISEHVSKNELYRLFIRKYSLVDFSILEGQPTLSGDLNGVHKYRRYLPQVLACFAKNLLLVQMGFTLAFPTILIAALTGHNSELNPNETMQSTPSQSTWIGEYSFPLSFVSINTRFSEYFIHMSTAREYIFRPNHRTDWTKVGNDNGKHSSGYCMASHVLCARLQLDFGGIRIARHQCGTHGSIRAHLHRWSVVSIHFESKNIGTNLFSIFLCSEPSIRGVLSVFAGIAYTVGIMLVFVLGALLSWRNAALVCFCAPWITAFAVCFVSKRFKWNDC